MLLTRDPPWALQRQSLTEVYHLLRDARGQGCLPVLPTVRLNRDIAHDVLVQRWNEELGFPVASRDTEEAVSPHFLGG